MKRIILIFAAISLLAGCGGGSVPAEKLADKLGKLKANTADKPHSVKLNNTVNIIAKGNDINKAIQSEGKYVILDLSECSATDNTLPDMSIIQDNAFLVGIVLPKSLITIEKDAFDGCQYLTSITIPAAVTSIGKEIPEDAFDGCKALTNITVAAANSAFSSVDGVLFDKGKTTLFLYPEGKSGNYTIPSSVTGIADCAFEICAKLTGVTIPDSVTTIGDEAFARNQLTSVTIPDSVTTIGVNAFVGNQLTSVTIPDSVTTIGVNAFGPLISITIGANVNIGEIRSEYESYYSWETYSIRGRNRDVYYPSFGTSFDNLYNNNGK